MGSLFPTISSIIASSTADAASLGGYVTLPVVAIVFAVTAVVSATILVKRLLRGGIKGATGTGRRGRRGRRR